MNQKSIVLAAAVLGLLSTSAFATTTAAHNRSAAAVVKFEAPVVTKVVNPTDLSDCYRGQTVRLTLTVDADGKVHDVGLLHRNDENLLRHLIPAVSQWQFTPARKNGVPVATHVVLPVELVERS